MINMKTSKHTAIAQCSSCGQTIISSSGGHFVYCKCGESFIDQERFSGAWVRLGGKAKLIEQICPSTCEHTDKHKGDMKFDDTEQLDKYMEKYGVKWVDGAFE